MRYRRPTGLQVVCVTLISLAGCGAYTQSFTVQYGDAVFRTFLDLLLTNAVNELVSTEPPPDMPPPADPCEDVSCAAGEICVEGACVPQPVDGDPDIGMMFYLDNSCDACHGVDAGGGIGPSLIGSTAEELFAKMSGAVAHGGGVVDGVTPQDAVDMEAWLNELDGGDPCAGITCDAGETCVDGACLSDDPCDGVMCDAGETCVDGVCVSGDPCQTGGDATAGMMFYFDNGCNNCHGDNADDGFAPGLLDSSCELLFDNMSGADSHAGGVTEGVTGQDAADLRAWLDSL